MHEEKRITNASIALNGESQREIIRLRARHCSLFVREWRERREREREREGGEETREERSRERGRPSSAARSSSDCDCVAHLIHSLIHSFIHRFERTNVGDGRTGGGRAGGMLLHRGQVAFLAAVLVGAYGVDRGLTALCAAARRIRREVRRLARRAMAREIEIETDDGRARVSMIVFALG